jgi:hypothetical protein
MFETETMAELCVKQGLTVEALAIYRRLLAHSPEPLTHLRRARRIAELEARDASPSEPRAAAPWRAPASTTPAPPPSIEAGHDGRNVTVAWRLPAGTHAPALQILVLRRAESGIAAEQRTVPVDHAEGRLTLEMAGVHSVRAAAGRLDGDRFVPLVRPDRARPPA